MDALISISKKTGFAPVTPGPVLILDTDGKVFYSHEVKGTFNLPSGDYIVPSGQVFKIVKPRVFTLPPLPKKERIRVLPKTFKITLHSVPDKARVNTFTGHMEFDKELMGSIPYPTRVFIGFHELGHYFYTTEWKCDLYAARKMVKLGFNPTQIATAIYDTLSNTPQGITRKQRLILNNYFEKWQNR